MRRAVFPVVCALLLLTAQLTALTHSVWHLHDYFPAQAHHDHVGAAHDRGGDQAPSSETELCVFHAVLGSLFAGGCTAQSSVAAAGFSDWFASYPAVRHIAQAALTPPSRAPPVLL
jgi:hypothetical protein